MDKLARTVTIDCIIEGDARGADKIAGIWANNNKIQLLEFPAEWKKHGKAAGPIRNKQMIDEGKPDLVIAFAGGSGTNNMIAQAEKVGIQVIRIRN